MLRTIIDSQLLRHMPDRNVVLTFDDGPSPPVSDRLLDVLGGHGIRAIFCPVGRQCPDHPEIIRRIVGEGHAIANHTVNHPPLQLCSSRRLGEELDGFTQILQEILEDPGHQPSLCRPPYGWINNRVLREIQHRGMGLCGISAFHYDTLYRPSWTSKLYDRMTRGLRKDRGGVIVIHEKIFVDGFWRRGRVRPDNIYNRTWVPDFVDRLIRELRAEGYTFDPEPFIRAVKLSRSDRRG
jgi:peptidoglycan/xylan/chitin deacetylase (PgdA/CDA1 family)